MFATPPSALYWSFFSKLCRCFCQGLKMCMWFGYNSQINYHFFPPFAGLDPEGLKTGGALTAKGMYRAEKALRGGEHKRGVPLIRGVRGASSGKFFKLDCLRVHFHAIFKSFSLILRADFFFSFLAILRKLLGQDTFVGSFSPSHWFKRGLCQFLAKECALYWLISYVYISLHGNAVM